MKITAYDLATRFVGIPEIDGPTANPQIMTMLKLDNEWPEDDSVPWCSAFVNYIAWLLRLPRSKSLRARSWLNVGRPIDYQQAKCGFDIVILNRGDGPQDPAIIKAPGHVGFYVDRRYDRSRGVHRPMVAVCGGNQGNTVSTLWYEESRILGVRRLKYD